MMHHKRFFWLIYRSSPATIKVMIRWFLIIVMTPIVLHGTSYPKVLLHRMFFWIFNSINPQACQLVRLKRVLRNASRSPYYKEIFERCDIELTSMGGLSGLKKIPITERATLQLRNEDFLVGNKPKYSVRTSGTEGIPVEIYLDRFSMANSYYLWKKVVKLSSSKLTDWHIHIKGDYFIGKCHKYEINELHRVIYFSAVCNSDDDFHLLTSIIKRYDVVFIRSMPSFMYLFSEYILRENKIISVRSVILDRELLFLHQKKIISKALGCNILNWYSNREQTLFGVDMGGGFVWDDFLGIMEIDEDSRVITTNLINYSMPLIRYSIGDQTSKDGTLLGRSSEVIYIGDKVIYPTVLQSITDMYAGIKECQFICKKDEIVIKVVPSGSISQERIADSVRSVAGKDIKVSFEIVERIPRGSRGKFKPIVNEKPS